MSTMTKIRAIGSNSITVNELIDRIISFIAFTLPFQIFAIPIPGKAIEAAHILGLVLVFLLTCLVLWKGRFQRFNGPEKGLFLCFGVACLSLVVGQLVYGWPAQLTKGIQQLVGLAFMILIFLAVRRHCNTPRAFENTLRWLWRGTLILALLGIWQFAAFNFLHITFLTDWKWTSFLNPSIGGWNQGFMGPVLRANSFAREPAHYCQFLLICIGLVIFRLYPPTSARNTSWNVWLPSFAVAAVYLVAYLLSFSLIGLLGLMIAVTFYIMLFRLMSFKKLLCFLLLGIVTFGGLNYVSQKELEKKLATISVIAPEESKGIETEAISALAVASNLSVAIISFESEPLLGWGIGGHPVAFEKYGPAWALNDKRLSKLNTEDAASMALRLISEMGIMGLIVFTGFFFSIIRKSWRAIRTTMSHEAAYPILPLCAGVLVGATAEIIIFMVRMGNFDIVYFWFLLAMASVIPEVLEQSIKS